MDPHIGDFQVAERIVEVIELTAIAIIVAAVAFALVGTVIKRIRSDEHKILTIFRRLLTPGLLIGLDLLVAADVIASVTLERTLESIAGLGLLVLIRTFLSWTLELETEGRWPWEPQSKDRSG
ncbi:MAG: DUF1622 domain-containing protein [Chloroflexi bacterium]|nr:DUF1622 domain-containing protein [Chloroflexota bacterium]